MRHKDGLPTQMDTRSKGVSSATGATDPSMCDMNWTFRLLPCDVTFITHKVQIQLILLTKCFIKFEVALTTGFLLILGIN